MAQGWGYPGTHVAEKVWVTFSNLYFIHYLYFYDRACAIFNRSLKFIQIFLQSLVDGEKDQSNPNLIRVNITKGYDVALKRYHGWFVQQLFKVISDYIFSEILYFLNVN